MFGEFLNIIVRSIKLDKSLYRDNKNFGEAAIYFAGLIMILDGIAGAVAANTIIKTAVAMSGLTAVLTWFVWSIFIFVVGVKLFPDKNTVSSHGELLRTIGFSSAPGIIRVFGITPDLMTVTFIGSAFWMLACMVVGVRSALDYKSLWRAFGVVVVAWLIQATILLSILVLFRNF